MPRKKIDREKVALQWRRTKIIATLGPASSSAAMIDRLIKAGVNVFRVNMSHGEHDSHRQTIQRVRRAAARAGRHIAILMDLCGPKIRVGRFENGSIELKTGATVVVTTRPVVGRDGLIPSQFRSLHKDVTVGERILLDDGKLELEVKRIDGRDLSCRVIEGGILSSHKGMNLPHSKLSVPALTPKDREDVRLGVELEVDFLALSFVRSARDVMQLRRYLGRLGAAIPVISKIERPEAVDDIDSIMDASYGIMLARGDLGIELPAERVPLIQMDLVRKSRQKGVPIIIATQMLESMMSSPRPTRAEVTDVAGATILSADAVMLSGETAVGQFPLQAVETMDRVVREVERHRWRDGSFADEPIADRAGKALFVRESMAHAAVQLVRDLSIEALIVPTHTGTTANIMASHRPLAPIVGATSDDRVCRRMALHWGLVPVQIESSASRNWREICLYISGQCELGRSGQDILLVSGFNEDPRKSEPVLKLIHI
ncbi:MAG TPA: pyruvate kinase [Gammaproteobacteria bacterium]|nr:pyruvate kinase [Gammaproteobacteria bacterium]